MKNIIDEYNEACANRDTDKSQMRSARQIPNNVNVSLSQIRSNTAQGQNRSILKGLQT